VKRFAYACVPVLALLVVAEAVTRVLAPGRIVLYPNQGNCQRRDTGLGRSLRSHCTATLQGKTFRTNALGLRDDEVLQDGRTRILAIGDSCTFGWGADQAHAYPQVLQARLDVAGGPRRYRVVNAGVPGYTSRHGLEYLRERGLALRPAIVLVGYGFNDIVPAGDVIAQLTFERRWMPLLRLDDALLDWSRLWRWVRHATLTPPPTDLPMRSSAEQYAQNLREIVRLARAHGVEPVLVSFWWGPQHEHMLALETVAREPGVPLVTYEGPHLDVIHPTADGYALLAGQVQHRLEEAGLLTQ
jgi:lysophospholipase L1-like esterase